MIYLKGDMSVCTEIIRWTMYVCTEFIRWTICYLGLNKVIVEEMCQ